MTAEGKTIAYWFFGICGGIILLCIIGLLIDRFIIHRKDYWKDRDPYNPPGYGGKVKKNYSSSMLTTQHQRQIIAYIKETRPDLKPGTTEFLDLYNSMWEEWNDDLKKKDVKLYK